jgi:hypothetical protein
MRVHVGSRVAVGERDVEWPAFVFVTSDTGSGCVPERHLLRDGAAAVVIEAYDTTELATWQGEELEAARADSLSGWTWCRASDGREGWVPERTLRSAD